MNHALVHNREKTQGKSVGAMAEALKAAGRSCGVRAQDTGKQGEGRREETGRLGWSSETRLRVQSHQQAEGVLRQGRTQGPKGGRCSSNTLKGSFSSRVARGFPPPCQHSTCGSGHLCTEEARA